MASENEINAEIEEVCVVCCKKITIFAIGTCDHPVCYECSTRMRVLCKQNECPICRRDMQKVIFTETKDTFTILMEKINSKSIVLQEKSIGVIFATISIQKAYQKLLEHRCPVCTRPNDQNPHRFRTFNDLKEHVRREHELFYCDLCVANLKIFTTERRCYTRQERATHRRKGDVDNKSHRGHPLCQFCDTRYMDLDELFRHLRRDHFYCHFCDMETANNQYYNSYDDLRAHFSQDHFLCEEGNCRLEQFTSVFKSLIDLKAHQASVHSKDLGKNAVKQARTVEVAFTLKPRQQKAHQNNSNHYSNHSNQSSNYSKNANYLNSDEEGAVGYDNSSRTTPTIHLDPNSSTDFPRLTPDIEIPSSSNTVRLSISKRNRPETNLSIKMSVPMSSSVQIRPKWNDFPALTQAGNSNIEIPKWVRTKSRPESSNGAILKVNPSDFRSPRRNLGSLSDFPELIQKEKVEKSEKNEKKGGDIVKKWSTVTLECVNPGNLCKKDVKSEIKKRNEKVKKKKKVGESENDNSERLKGLNLVSNTSGINEVGIGSERKVTKKVSELKINPLNSDFCSEDYRNQDSYRDCNDKSCQNSNEKSYQNSKEKNNQESNQKRSDNSPQKSHRNTKIKNDQQNDKVFQKSHQNINLKSLQKNNQENNEKYHQNNNQQSSKQNSEINLQQSHQNITENPPPGFSSKKLKPPPGFEGYQSLLPSEMTFTNSTGQSFPILTSNSSYKPPKDFEKRNENLIKNLNKVAEGDNVNSVIEFKRLSALFRNGNYDSKSYYDLCRETMKSAFDRLFPELLVLLPDVAKQRELFEEHLKRTDDKKGLEVCLSCDQVVLKRDMSEHYMTHALENNFPVLGNRFEQPDLEMNYWRK